VGDARVPAFFYAHEYDQVLPPGHRFPMGKFRAIWEGACRIHGTGLWRLARQATREELLAFHEPAYVDAVLAGTLSPEQRRAIGLDVDVALARRTAWETGGTLAAARYALEHGCALNCGGGGHHAWPARGSGFCVFNDLAVTVRRLLREGAVRRVLLLDLDVHQGDANAGSFQHEPEIFTFSMHAEDNWPPLKPPGDWDLPLPTGLDDRGYLDLLRGALPELLDRRFPEPGLVLYDAGADVHQSDPLGKLALTTAGVYARDRLVLEACRARGLPVAGVCGGGYGSDLAQLAQRHLALHHAAREVFG
jgi:acetoin utilization deacetylase AcuC-like enzyme